MAWTFSGPEPFLEEDDKLLVINKTNLVKKKVHFPWVPPTSPGNGNTNPSTWGNLRVLCDLNLQGSVPSCTLNLCKNKRFGKLLLNEEVKK